MEKVAFIVDGGFFVKKYKEHYKKFPTAKEVEQYILQIFTYIRKNHNQYNSIEMYRIFYYDCPPLHNLKGLTSKPKSMSDCDFKNVSNSFERRHKSIRKFHDDMKRQSFFALRMGQLKFQGWVPSQTNPKKYWRFKLTQKGVDMRMGLDIASITAKRLCTKIVLISGDTDMIPAMKTARKEGVHVYWHSMDNASHLDLATHSDVIISKKSLEASKASSTSKTIN